MDSTIPNLTFDTSCIIPLLHLSKDKTKVSEINALEKMKVAHNNQKVKIWVSPKSINESYKNLREAEKDDVKKGEWLETLSSLKEFDSTKSAFILGLSSLGLDTGLLTKEQSQDHEKIKNILIGNKVSVKEGDSFDIAIFFEHYIQGNDLFITLDTQIFRPTVIARIQREFAARILIPSKAISILEAENHITFD